MAGWADWTYAEAQRGVGLLAQEQGRQAIAGFVQALGNAAGAYADQIARTTPQYLPGPTYSGPSFQSCQSSPNGGGWMTTCQ